MPTSSPHPFYSPDWLTADRLDLPAQQSDWLLHLGSLTERLQLLGELRVVRLYEGDGQLAADEALFLGLPPHASCQIREVLLEVDQQPFVYARSVLPASSLEGANQELASMAERPLGSELFRDPVATRQQLDACFLPREQLPKTLDISDTTLLARRSRFCKNHQPLLVAECFLPALWRRLTAS